MNQQIKIELANESFQTHQPIFIAWANPSAGKQSQIAKEYLKQEKDLIIKEEEGLLFIKDEDDMEIIELIDSEDEEKPSITWLNSIQSPAIKISQQLSMALTNQNQKSLKKTSDKNINSSNNQPTARKRNHSSMTSEFDSASKKRKLGSGTDQIEIIPYIPETYPPRRTSTDSNSSKHSSYSTGSSSSTNNSSEHQCNICMESFKRNIDLIHHLSSHTEAKFDCKRCGMKFKHEGNFKKHECIACDLCGETFIFQKQLRSHQVKVHGIKTHMCECDICGKELNERSDIKKHIMKRHMKYEGKFECDFCGKRFKLKSTLTRHIKLNEAVIECKLCGKKIKKGSLYSHMKQVHVTQKNFECQVCLASFKTGPSLKSHMGIHEMSFECTECGKRFPSKSSLKEHEELHINPEVYKCKFCEKSFPLKASWNKHIKSHENGNLIRIFKSKSCTYSTDKAENLKKHEINHKRKDEKTEKTKNWMQCEKCPLKLKNKLKLAAHYWKKHNE